MDWLHFEGKPLVFFEGNTVEDVVLKTGYQCKDEDARKLYKLDTRATEYFEMLLQNKDFNKEAIQFFSSAVNPRVRIWWGYQCVKATFEEINLNPKAKVGAKQMAEEAANDPAHKALLSLKPEDFKHPPKIVDGVNLSDPTSWDPPSLNSDGTLSVFPKVLAESPLRKKSGVELFFEQRAQGLASMPDEIREKFLKKEAEELVAAQESLGMTPEELASKLNDTRQMAKGTPPESPFASLEGKFADSKAALDKSLGEMKKRVAGMKEQLPNKPPRKMAGSSNSMSALEAAKDWLILPSEENAQKALEIGKVCKNNEKPAGLLAQSAFWSGISLAPPGKPVVPPPPKLPARSVATAMVIAAHLPGGTKSPDERFADYLKIGIESAQGIRTWENQILPEHGEDKWSGKSGFGREYN